MEDIKVGEYVRSKIGSIGKITKIEDDKFLYENKTLITWVGNITKHSFNLIDLLEYGYIVVMLDTKFNTKDYIFIDDNEMLKAVKEDLKSRCELLEILTHEQFEANAYKVKGE